jgi:hypothetical protein
VFKLRNLGLMMLQRGGRPDASKLVGITKPANARVLSTAMIDDLEGVVSEKQG